MEFQEINDLFQSYHLFKVSYCNITTSQHKWVHLVLEVVEIVLSTFQHLAILESSAPPHLCAVADECLEVSAYRNIDVRPSAHLLENWGEGFADDVHQLVTDILEVVDLENLIKLELSFC